MGMCCRSNTKLVLGVVLVFGLGGNACSSADDASGASSESDDRGRGCGTVVFVAADAGAPRRDGAANAPPRPAGDASTGTPVDPGTTGDSGAGVDASPPVPTDTDADAGNTVPPEPPSTPVTCASDPLKVGDSRQDAYDCQVITLSEQHGLPDPMMMKAQIAGESDFNPFAVSPDSPCGIPNGWTDAESKSFGLIQMTLACGEAKAALLPNGHPNLTRDTNSSLWATSAFNPTINLGEAAKTLGRLRESYEKKYAGCSESEYTLMTAGGYNSGEQTVSGCARYNARAQNYVTYILGRYRGLAQKAGWAYRY